MCKSLEGFVQKFVQKFQPICAKVPACGPPARSEWTRPGRRSLLENPYSVDPNGAKHFCSTFCSHFCSHFCALTSLGQSSVGSLCVGALLGHPCWRLSSLRDCPTRIKASISDPAGRPTTCNCSRSVQRSHLEKCIFANALCCSSGIFYL